jgi:hypothetical protein
MPSPKRILHVIDPGSPGGGSCTLRLLAGAISGIDHAEHDLVILGTRRHAEHARRCGLEPIGLIPLSEQFPAAARHALSRWLAAFEHRSGAYDIIHAWTARSVFLASLAAPTHRRIGTLTMGPSKCVVTRMMKVTLDRHPMPLMASSPAVIRECESCGLTMDRASVMPVAVQHDDLERSSREEVRKRWGAGNHDFVVGLLCEPMAWVDAPLATAVLTRLRVSGRSVRLVMSPDVFRRVASERWARHAGTRDMLVFDDAAAVPWRIVQGLDAALSLGCKVSGVGCRECSALPVMWAMAAGVPVIAEAAAGFREVIEDGVTGVLIRAGDANEASKELARLHDERSIGNRIGTAATRHAREHSCMPRYIARLKEMYERTAQHEH